MLLMKSLLFSQLVILYPEIFVSTRIKFKAQRFVYFSNNQLNKRNKQVASRINKTRATSKTRQV